MRARDAQQIGFSTLLFDTLFGLVLFFGLDSFLDITSAPHFIFYMFATIILVHWWLTFKSADDAFSGEVQDSTADLLFGIIYLILIEYIILYAKTFQYSMVTWFLLALLSVDLVWALIWRFVGSWDTKKRSAIVIMERELIHNIVINGVAIVLFSILGALHAVLSSASYVLAFVLLYLFYIFLTFKTKILDLKIF